MMRNSVSQPVAKGKIQTTHGKHAVIEADAENEVDTNHGRTRELRKENKNKADCEQRASQNENGGPSGIHLQPAKQRVVDGVPHPVNNLSMSNKLSGLTGKLSGVTMTWPT